MGTLTKVGAVMCAAHRDVNTGRLHGHTWEVWASFPFDGTSAVERQAQLKAAVAEYDHDELPQDIAWAEPFAAHIGETLAGCLAIEISRPSEMLSALWHPTPSPENPHAPQ